MRLTRMSLVGWIAALAILFALLARPFTSRETPVGEHELSVARSCTAMSSEEPRLLWFDGPVGQVPSDASHYPAAQSRAMDDVASDSVRKVVEYRLANPVAPSEEGASPRYVPLQTANVIREPRRSSPQPAPHIAQPKQDPAQPNQALELTKPRTALSPALPVEAFSPATSPVENRYASDQSVPPPTFADPVGPVRDGDPETTHAQRPMMNLRGDGPGMQAVDDLARKHVLRGFSLGDRSALFSARTEFLRAMRMVAQAVDSRAGLGSNHPSSCSAALASGLQALEEADDFSPTGSRLEGEIDLRVILDSHRTPIAKGKSPTTALAAMQLYFDFARVEFTRAAASNRICSQALSGLGKSYSVLLDKPTSNERLAGPKAMVFQQAALAADSTNHLASNELGVLYGRFGQWESAKQAFLQSLMTVNDAATWQNLAIAHERLGERELAALALREKQLLTSSKGLADKVSAVDGSSTVRWVDSKEFTGPPEDGLPTTTKTTSNAAPAKKTTATAVRRMK